WFTGDKTMIRFRIDRSAARAGLGNFARRLQGIQIENRDASPRISGGRNIQTAPGRIGVNIINPARAAHFHRFYALILSEHGNGGCKDQTDSYHDPLAYHYVE